MRRETQGALLALASALLFGLVNAAAKTTTADPIVAAGVAYLVAGLALSWTLRDARIPRGDWPKILTMSLAGGAIAPALLFLGLAHASATNASLLLTLEMVFTALLAFLFLRERARGVQLIGLVVLFLAAVVAAIASARTDGTSTNLLGVGFVTLATIAWSIDNVVSTRLVGDHKPHHLVAMKGLFGGSAVLIAALALGRPLTVPPQDWAALAFIALFGVGASIVLFYHALQRQGATRTSAIVLPAAAITGVLAGTILLREGIGTLELVAVALVIAGTLLATRAIDSQAMPPTPPAG